jgi:glycosyltransferase involved in cell wall biosynthesis
VFEIRDFASAAMLRAPEPGAMAYLRRELGLGADPVIVYTGNLDRRQGIESLIEAMPTVIEHFPGTLLLLVGGDSREIVAMRQHAELHGVSGSVRLIGQRPLQQMPEIMALATALVSPRQEPNVTPLKIYGYMASGRPIVATDLPTHRAVLDERLAILTPPTAKGLAEGLLRVLADPDHSERRGRRAKAKVQKCHTYEVFRDQLKCAYAAIHG